LTGFIWLRIGSSGGSCELGNGAYIEEINNFIEFEVFTAVVMKSIIFWDMTPCSPLSCNNLLNYFFDLEDGGDMFFRHVGCNSTDYTESYPRR
jgi:hypothetical protein